MALLALNAVGVKMFFGHGIIKLSFTGDKAMSVVLSVYSQSAYKEFVLPAIHNAETVLVIDRKIFHLQDDLEIRLEMVDQKWAKFGSRAVISKGYAKGTEWSRVWITGYPAKEQALQAAAGELAEYSGAFVVRYK